MMPKKKITILLTDVNHPVTPGAIEILKSNKNYSITIIGVDSSNSNQGSLWVDKFYNVSKAESPNFIKELLKLSLINKVDVVLPWANSDSLAISKQINKFQSKNIKVLCNTYKITKTLVDKGLLYQSLKESNIPIPKYYLISNIVELKNAISLLNYPKNKIIVKPRSLSGGRGLFVLSEKSDIDTRNINHNLPKNALFEIFKTLLNKSDLNYIAMEYLKGEDYSVDTLSSEGKSIFIVQRKRLSDIGGVSSIGEMVYDKKIHDTVKKIISYFKIDYNCNIQLRYRNGRLGQPYVYDINPRISGTIVANTYAGIDLLTFGIYQILNIPFPKNLKYKRLKMIRYWSEKYEKISDDLY